MTNQEHSNTPDGAVAPGYTEQTPFAVQDEGLPDPIGDIKCPDKKHDPDHTVRPLEPEEQAAQQAAEAEAREAAARLPRCPWCKHQGVDYRVTTNADGRMHLAFITVACAKCNNTVGVSAVPIAMPQPALPPMGGPGLIR